jgi:hypothetical protein
VCRLLQLLLCFFISFALWRNGKLPLKKLIFEINLRIELKRRRLRFRRKTMPFYDGFSPSLTPSANDVASPNNLLENSG